MLTKGVHVCPLRNFLSTKRRKDKEECFCLCLSAPIQGLETYYYFLKLFKATPNTRYWVLGTKGHSHLSPAKNLTKPNSSGWCRSLSRHIHNRTSPQKWSVTVYHRSHRDLRVCVGSLQAEQLAIEIIKNHLCCNSYITNNQTDWSRLIGQDKKYFSYWLPDF